MSLAAKIYEGTQLEGAAPDALQVQLRTNAVAVACSIAEGAARRRRSEFVHFLRTARTSLLELETHVLLASGQNGIAQSDELLVDIADLQHRLAVLLERLADTPRRLHARACAPEAIEQ